MRKLYKSGYKVPYAKHGKYNGKDNNPPDNMYIKTYNRSLKLKPQKLYEKYCVLIIYSEHDYRIVRFNIIFSYTLH